MNSRGSEVKVEPMTRRAVRPAGRLLAGAFHDDPVIGHFLPPTTRRRAAFPGFFRSTIEEALPHGHVYQVAGARMLLGAAVWFPPSDHDKDPRPPWRARVALLPATAVFRSRLIGLLAGFERLGEHHPSQPHWYLAFVGIRPDQQSNGLGARVLAPVLQLADAAGQPCYLETPFPRTHAFYERLGFERVEELRVFEGAPPVVTFLRPAPGRRP